MKLIIDIPKDLYDMTRTPNNVNYIMRMAGFICSAIANGTPLDDVKAEIADIYCGQYCENPLTADAVREMILDMLDNIGKVDMRGDT